MDWSATATLSATSVPHLNPPLKKGREQSPLTVVHTKARTQTDTPHKVISKLSAQRHDLDSRLRGNDKHSTVLLSGLLIRKPLVVS